MFDVFKVVNWLRVKNNAELKEYDYAEELTQMKAMKLLYYIQGVSMIYMKKKMFPQKILAWKYGPVIKEVHDKYSGQREIVGKISQEDIKDYEELSKNEKVNNVLNTVWDTFGNMSAAQLMKRTHSESPWKETKRNAVITDDKMKAFFATIVSEKD